MRKGNTQYLTFESALTDEHCDKSCMGLSNSVELETKQKDRFIMRHDKAKACVALATIIQLTNFLISFKTEYFYNSLFSGQ